MLSLPELIRRLSRKPARVPAPPAPAREKRPVAYVNCGRDIEFTADFIVGMTLSQFLEWLQECCATRPGVESRGEIPWLPQRLMLANSKEVGMDYVISEGDILILADPALPSPREQKLVE